jgi:hypothetical protein
MSARIVGGGHGRWSRLTNDRHELLRVDRTGEAAGRTLARL